VKKIQLWKICWKECKKNVTKNVKKESKKSVEKSGQNFETLWLIPKKFTKYETNWDWFDCSYTSRKIIEKISRGVLHLIKGRLEVQDTFRKICNIGTLFQISYTKILQFHTCSKILNYFNISPLNIRQGFKPNCLQELVVLGNLSRGQQPTQPWIIP